MFKGLFRKMANVSKLEFEDNREQAIYELGMDAGRRELDMESTLQQLVSLVGTFIVYKAVNHYIKKVMDCGREEYIESYMEENDL